MNFFFKQLPIYCADIMVLVFAILYKIASLNFSIKPETQRNNPKPLIILGNGPSLKTDINDILLDYSTKEICVVNYFANTDLFTTLKPSCYVLIDPVFWSEKINENIKSDNRTLIANLLKVDWDMEVICVAEGYEIIKEQLTANPKISVKEIKAGWFDLRSEKANVFALKYRLSSPNFVNVLIAAIWYALVCGRRSIEIYGADFSSFKELTVDQKTNRVATSSTHFYRESHVLAEVKEKYIGVPPKMINVRFYQLWLGFRQMYLLSRLAHNWGARVVNRSSFSYLDCFDRS